MRLRAILPALLLSTVLLSGCSYKSEGHDGGDDDWDFCWGDCDDAGDDVWVWMIPLMFMLIFLAIVIGIIVFIVSLARPREKVIVHVHKDRDEKE